MDTKPRLYLFTLEVKPLSVGETYNPLPAHLTLMSRFWSNLSPEELSEFVAPIFRQTKIILLKFSESALLGPQKTKVDLIAPTKELENLHNQLKAKLDSANVEFTNPQWVGGGWKPHVSKRAENNFKVGGTLQSSSVYLIEVKIENNDHVRFIKNKFNLSL